MSPERRQFERLAIEGEAIALDTNGCRLGLVSHAGGGGMSIKLDRPHGPFAPGHRLRIIVEEPPSGIRHTVTVEVKYSANGDIGVEFVSPA